MSLEVTSKFNIPVITPNPHPTTPIGGKLIYLFLPLYYTMVFFLNVGILLNLKLHLKIGP